MNYALLAVSLWKVTVSVGLSILILIFHFTERVVSVYAKRRIMTVSLVLVPVWKFDSVTVMTAAFSTPFSQNNDNYFFNLSSQSLFIRIQKSRLLKWNWILFSNKLLFNVSLTNTKVVLLLSPCLVNTYINNAIQGSRCSQIQILRLHLQHNKLLGIKARPQGRSGEQWLISINKHVRLLWCTARYENTKSQYHCEKQEGTTYYCKSVYHGPCQLMLLNYIRQRSLLGPVIFF